MKEKVKKYLPIFICWILASIGLFWQVYQVSKMFFTFSTRVDIEMDAPLNLTMPAITICLPLKPNLITLKSLFDVHNLTFDQIFEEVTYLPINVLATLETIDVKVSCRTKYPRVIADAPEGQPCDLFGTTVQRIQYNPHLKVITRCTTYLSQSSNEPSLTVIANEAKDFYALDVYSPGSNVLYVYVHNPLEILNLPESDFFVIFTKQSSDIVITASRITVNLPSDTFGSKCSDYSGYLFGRMSCIFQCRLRRALSLCGSWSPEVPAPLNVTLPFRNRTQNCPLPSKKYNCTGFNVCPEQCERSWYTTSLVWNHMKETHSNMTKFFVRRPYGLQFVYNVTPYMAPVEYSCYVATCLGIWFGISFSDIMLQMFKSLKDRGKRKNQPLPTIKFNQRRRRKFDQTRMGRSLDQRLNFFVSWSSTSSNQFSQRKAAFPPTYLS